MQIYLFGLIIIFGKKWSNVRSQNNWANKTGWKRIAKRCNKRRKISNREIIVLTLFLKGPTKESWTTTTITILLLMAITRPAKPVVTHKFFIHLCLSRSCWEALNFGKRLCKRTVKSWLGSEVGITSLTLLSRVHTFILQGRSNRSISSLNLLYAGS